MKHVILKILIGLSVFYILFIISVWGIRLNGNKYIFDLGYGLGNLYFILLSLIGLIINMIGIGAYLKINKMSNKNFLIVILIINIILILYMISLIEWNDIKIRKIV